MFLYLSYSLYFSSRALLTFLVIHISLILLLCLEQPILLVLSQSLDLPLCSNSCFVHYLALDVAGLKEIPDLMDVNDIEVSAYLGEALMFSFSGSESAFAPRPLPHCWLIWTAEKVVLGDATGTDWTDTDFACQKVNLYGSRMLRQR